jgi:hypothetical protein
LADAGRVAVQLLAHGRLGIKMHQQAFFQGLGYNHRAAGGKDFVQVKGDAFQLKLARFYLCNV